MRLIWDFLGSEFGSRHAQYEKFYGGAVVPGEAERLSQFRLGSAPAAGGRALNLPPLE